MVFLGFGKYARADKIYALEPLRGDERGEGRRTRVWIEGVSDPIVASRTEPTILLDVGSDAGKSVELVDDAVDLANRLVQHAESGRVDLGDRSRRARRLLESTSGESNTEQLFQRHLEPSEVRLPVWWGRMATALGPLRRHPPVRRLFVGQTISTFGSE